MNIIFEMKIWNIFLIHGPNIDCQCLLEPPHWGSSNKQSLCMYVENNWEIMYTPTHPTFPYTNWGLRWRVLTEWIC